MAGNNAIIIKRVKKGGHGGHHGGAWKVAYADFVTAMMAFFLLMWLINTTTPEQKRGIADYFAPQSITQSSSGAGGVLGGLVLSQSASRAGGSATLLEKSAPALPPHASSQGAASSQPSSQSTNAQAQDARIAGSNARSESDTQDEFSSAAESIRQAIKEMPDIADLSRQVIMDRTPQGFRIQLVDQDGKPMFTPGSSTPLPYTKTLLAIIAKIIDRLPNRISICGHTNAAATDGAAGASNWELSAARANSARAILTAGGIPEDRIYEVAGKAGSEPLLPEDPADSSNRRLSIVLMKEAPPVPPDHRI
jgi:chemotaxis protein MotB